MRQFVSTETPDARGRLRVNGKDWHYLRDVLRLRDGDAVDVADATGSAAHPMRLQTDGGSTGLLVPIVNASDNGSVVSSASSRTEGSGRTGFLQRYRFILLQFLPKTPKFDLILRQAVEVGVSTVVPIRGEFSPPLGDGRWERWQKIVKEARQQSGSPIATAVLPVMSVEDAVCWWRQQSGVGYMLDELEEGEKVVSSSLPRVGIAEPQTSTDALAIAVGCEGGISPAERGCLRGAGFRALHFPVNVMRVETAALYGMAAIQTSLYGGKYWLVNA